MRSRVTAVVTSLLLLLALAAGTWKILAFSSANRELHRQNEAYAAAIAQLHESIQAVRESSLKRGSPAKGFTLLGLDGWALRVEPAAEARPVHLLFLDPARAKVEAHRHFTALLDNYRLNFGRAQPAPRTVILVASGYEQARAALAGQRVPYRVGVHAGEVYRLYGFIDGPGMAVIDSGIVRAKWRLPFTGDQLPID